MADKMMKAEEIARAFLHEMNPVNWNGQGEMPAGVDIVTSEPSNSFYNHWVCQTANATYHLYVNNPA